MFGYGTNVPLQKNVPPMPKVRFDTYSDDKFETVCFEKEDEEYSWQVDYSKEKGLYRVTQFLNNHWHGEIIFNEVEK